MTSIKQTTQSLPPVLEEILARVVRALEPERVYLFGSRARGDEDSDSDFDLLIVVRRSDLPGYARDRIALRSLRGLRVPVDTIVLTHDEFERKRHVASSLPATIDREGKLLYAMPSEQLRDLNLAIKYKRESLPLERLP